MNYLTETTSLNNIELKLRLIDFCAYCRFVQISSISLI